MTALPRGAVRISTLAAAYLPLVAWVAATAVVTSGCDRKTPAKASRVDAVKTIVPATSSDNATFEADGQPSLEIFDREAAMVEAADLARSGDLSAAASSLEKILLMDPNDVDVLFALARVEAAAGNLPKAVGLLGEIPEDHPQAGLASLGQSADWCFQLGRFAEAERRYLKVLERVPHAVPAHRQLAYLLNRQGRRHEAARHARELCKQGNVRQDELHSLISLGNAMYDDPSQPAPPGERPYWPIGQSGRARWLVSEEMHQEAISVLEDQVGAGIASAAAVAMYGRAAAEAQDDERFQWWLARIDDSVREQADYWAAIAIFELSQRRFETATRALGEAIDRDPTDLVSMARMRQVLTTMGDQETAQRWLDRWNAIHEMIDVNNRIADSDPPEPSAITELAERLEALDRPLEALLWKTIGGLLVGTPRSEMSKWIERREALVESGTGFPSRSQRLCGMDLDRYPLPKLDTAGNENLIRSGDPKRQLRCAGARLENVANQVGLNHTYQVASQPQQQRFTIYQMLGGGVAVLDYDRDGACDLYFAQGAADPPSFRGALTNQLFRHVDSRLTDVSQASAAEEFGYSTGLTAGDWNQDGFPDLVIASIGGMSLKINNGDGTFTDHPIAVNTSIDKVPASTALADVNGDGLPDVTQVFYVDDPAMQIKPAVDESGRVLEAVLPKDFEAGSDWLIENDGSGGCIVRELSHKAIGTGLGIVVTNFNDHCGNEIFVGNDLLPNQLWVRDPVSGEFSDVASLLGCAYGFTGGMTASMGIAAGDFDNNGSLDIHITNFANASLFLGQGEAFQDRNVQFGLDADSKRYVGFGTQAIDYDNNGYLDLVVTNGHIDDAITARGGFKQPPQLFCNLADRFELAGVVDPSHYWDAKHVGRALAKLDFNRDGREDIVVTHINQPSALLLNRTTTHHHWLQIRLVGTTSERDAIGARLRIRSKSGEANRWVTAGDGYLSSNQQLVHVGLGEAQHVEEMTIFWPSGVQQTLGDLQADQRLMVIENQPDPFELE